MTNIKLFSDFVTDADELNESLFIHDIARLMRKRFDKRARSLGLTRAQWLALAVLRRHPGINQAELADRLEVEPMTIARLVDRLEEAGWVERRADSKDRRSNRIYLTERVKSIVGQIRELAIQNRREALSGISVEEHDILVNILRKIKINVIQ